MAYSTPMYIRNICTLSYSAVWILCDHGVLLFSAGIVHNTHVCITINAVFQASHSFAMQVVRSLLVSLAHHETYHAMFNHFVRQNPLILEEKEYGFLKHCMGLLDYKNKLSWIRRKLAILK